MPETNPFEQMDYYTRDILRDMPVEELIEAQRSVLFPKEREIFDSKGLLQFQQGDGRDAFFSFTDDLILGKT